MMLAASESSGGGGGGGPANGYAGSFVLTIDHTQVGGATLTDFPLCVRETQAVLKSVANGGSVTTNAGAAIPDLAFFSDAGLTTPLDYEREVWDATTGELVAHVRIPSLSHTVDTVLYLGYGKASIVADPANPAAVWDSNYKAVYHFPFASGTYPATTREDSTANNNDLSNGSTFITQGAAQIGNGLVVTNSFWVLEAADAASLRPSAALTVEAWAKFPDFAAYRAVLGKANDGVPRRNYVLFSEVTTGKAIFSVTQGGTFKDLVGTSALSTSAFSHIVGTYDGSTQRVYVNGTQENSVALSGAVDTSTADTLWIGCEDYGFGAVYPLAGYVDEVRVSNVARSAGWIAAQYNNQKSSSTFYTVT